jgi:hypothetical protein
MTTNEAVSHFLSFSNYMYEMSQGQLVLAGLGRGSDITPSLVLPGSVAQYDDTGLGALFNNSRAAAQAAGYDLTQYDFTYVCTDNRPAADYSGLGFIGQPGFHLAHRAWGSAVSSHEFGHNLGLNHAHFWDTDRKSIIGAGQNVEYGDGDDPMGNGGSPNSYNSRYRNYLGWIPDTDIVDLNAAGSGEYRLYAFDLDHSVVTRAEVPAVQFPELLDTISPTHPRTRLDQRRAIVVDRERQPGQLPAGCALEGRLRQ